MACPSAPPSVDVTRLAASDAGRWEFTGDLWQVGEAVIARSDVASRFPQGRSVVAVVMPLEESSGTSASVLIAGLDHGVGRFDIGHPGDAELWSVEPPPARGASRSFAVVSVRAEGVTVAAPGGAEVAVPCGACAEASDWRFDGVADALDEAAVDEVLVAFSSAVPWGATLAGIQSAGPRRVRIARGD